MTTRSGYVKKQAAVIRGRIGELMANVRESIVAGAGFPINSGLVRVRRRELSAVVAVLCSDMIPSDNSEMAAVLVREPWWLETESEEGSSSLSMREWLGREMVEAIVSELAGDIHVAVLDQYEGATFASVVSEIRSIVKTADYVGISAQAALITACDNQESKNVPCSRVLLAPIEKMRQALTHAGLAGDRPRLISARILMELADLIDARGYGLDITHVPVTESVGSSPRR